MVTAAVKVGLVFQPRCHRLDVSSWHRWKTISCWRASTDWPSSTDPVHPVPDRHEIMAAIEKVRERRASLTSSTYRMSFEDIAVPLSMFRGITHAANEHRGLCQPVEPERSPRQGPAGPLRQASELATSFRWPPRLDAALKRQADGESLETPYPPSSYVRRVRTFLLESRSAPSEISAERWPHDQADGENDTECADRTVEDC